MKSAQALAVVALTGAMPCGAVHAAPPLFSCRLGPHTVTVTDNRGQLSYRYTLGPRVEMALTVSAGSGRVLEFIQRMAGMEYQLRFKNRDFSYIVYSSEADPRSDAHATSGLVVMKGVKRVVDKSCQPLAVLILPPEVLPQDADTFSAM